MHRFAAATLLLASCSLLYAGAASAQLTFFPGRIYVSDMPAEEKDAMNENFSPATLVGPVREGGGRRIQWRHKAIGEPVVVEGIALGQPSAEAAHMTTQRVAYEGGRIYVRGVSFKDAKAAGRLVRVKGKLAHSQEGVASFGPHDVKIEQYFYIDATSVELIEQTTDPLLVLPGLK
jgi:hypothetical protein